MCDPPREALVRRTGGERWPHREQPQRLGGSLPTCAGVQWLLDFHLGFASRLAAVASRFEGTRVGESVEKAIERSLASLEKAIG